VHATWVRRYPYPLPRSFSSTLLHGFLCIHGSLPCLIDATISRKFPKFLTAIQTLTPCIHTCSTPLTHGSTDCSTGRDRWFDKSFQLVVAKNGRSAINFEHAWGDGAAVLRYFDEVYTCANGLPLLPPAESPAALPSSTLEPLVFSIDSQLSSTIAKALTRFDAHVEAAQFSMIETDSISGKLLRQHKIGGDGTMQMAFQLAHYQMYGHSASTCVNPNYFS
jgi:hypothetical protein